jgi:hypothetical protein
MKKPEQADRAANPFTASYHTKNLECLPAAVVTGLSAKLNTTVTILG